MATNTPWGPSQQANKIARGIMSYSTAGHGGFHLSYTMNDKVPVPLRNRDGWYEEDCEYAKVVLAFQQHFDAPTIERAHRTAKNSYHDLYEAWRRLTEPSYEVPLEESRSKREDKFYRDNRDNMVVISASNSTMRPGMVECFAVLGGRDRRGHYDKKSERLFLVPKTEYETRSEFGFVIQPSHAEMAQEKTNVATDQA